MTTCVLPKRVAMCCDSMCSREREEAAPEAKNCQIQGLGRLHIAKRSLLLIAQKRWACLRRRSQLAGRCDPITLLGWLKLLENKEKARLRLTRRSSPLRAGGSVTCATKRDVALIDGQCATRIHHDGDVCPHRCNTTSIHPHLQIDHLLSAQLTIA